MTDNAVNKSICIDDDEDNESKQNNTSYPEAIKCLAQNLFKDYPEKTTNLTNNNIKGVVEALVLNEYMEVNFGYRYKVLDKLVEVKTAYVVSHKGFGIEKLIESYKSVQASFEQTQLTEGLRGMLRRN